MLDEIFAMFSESQNEGTATNGAVSEGSISNPEVSRILSRSEISFRNPMPITNERRFNVIA